MYPGANYGIAIVLENGSWDRFALSKQYRGVLCKCKAGRQVLFFHDMFSQHLEE